MAPRTSGKTRAPRSAASAVTLEENVPEVTLEENVPEVTLEENVPEVVLTVKKFVSISTPLHHPFMHVVIPTGSPGALLELPDSWLECQIERGLVKEM